MDFEKIRKEILSRSLSKEALVGIIIEDLKFITELQTEVSSLKEMVQELEEARQASRDHAFERSFRD